MVEDFVVVVVVVVIVVVGIDIIPDAADTESDMNESWINYV